jgi:hypothetical protein
MKDPGNAKTRIVTPDSVLDAESKAVHRRVQSLAHFLDDSYQVLGIRFGWDSVFGLVPVVGDTFSMVLSLYIVAEAARAGASQIVLTRMITNIAADSILGAIPIAGDLFDVGFKSNRRNVRILSEHLQNPERVRKHSKAKLIAILLICGALGVALMIIALLCAAWIAKKIGLF